MSGHRITLCVQALLLLFNLDYPIFAQSGEVKTGTATISGRVTLKGEPARGVTILLQGQKSDAINPPRAKTDEDGRFRFTSVTAGSYSISAIAPGYLSPGVDGIINRGQAINIAEGENFENISLEINRGGVIAGRITDSHGVPVIEEQVNLYKLDKDGKPKNFFLPTVSYEVFRTDDRGVYRIFGLPEGRYLVSVGQDQNPGSTSITLSDRFYSRVFYQRATSEAAAEVIEVTEGSEASDVDITVPEPKKAYKVYGRVVDAGAGQPVPGVEFIVGALSQDGKLTGGLSGVGERSKPNGEFHFMVASPGRYMLFVRADSPGDSEIIGEPVIFDVGEGDTTSVEVKVRQAGSISGVVVIEGTSDPKILSKLSQINLRSFYRSIKYTIPKMPIFSGIPDVKVNADGGFRIGGLQPGNVFIAMKPAPDILGLTVARIERNGAAADNGFDVRMGEQVTGVRIVLAYSTLKIRGELKVVGGALPAGISFHVVARRVGQLTPWLPIAQVDARGRFLIESAPPGEYEIWISPNYAPNIEPLDMQTKRLISLVKERVIVAGADPEPIVLVIDLNRKERDR